MIVRETLKLFLEVEEKIRTSAIFARLFMTEEGRRVVFTTVPREKKIIPFVSRSTSRTNS